MQLYRDRDQAEHVGALISAYPARELASPFRSTVPLLSLLKDAEAVQGLTRAVGLDARSLEVHLEYTVRSPRGEGKPSHTDAMLIDGERSVAAEAKWTEPPYDRVARWLLKGGPNRREVMAGWLALLQRVASGPLDPAQFGDARYQMVHRAASACAAGTEPSVAYVQFTPLPDGATPPHVEQLRNDLAHFASLLGLGCALRLFVIEIVIETTGAFERIKNLPKGLSDTGESVREALLADEPLFEFRRIKAENVVAEVPA